eukprot:34159_1
MASESTWLSMFPNMSTGMKLQMIIKPPPSLSKDKIFSAILALPHKERDRLIHKIPPRTLKPLVLSLPRESQVCVLEALSNNTNNNQKRDFALQEAVHKTHPHISPLNPTKIRRKLHQITKKSESSHNCEFDSVEAISDYEDDHDLSFDLCSKHINRAQFKREELLLSSMKMMRSFGDGPCPSRYSALILLNHIKSYLKCLIHKMDQTKGTAKRKQKQSKSQSLRVLNSLEEWYPQQVKVFKKWKYFKFEAKKHENKAPDLVNDNEEDSDMDREEDNDYMENIRKSKSEYTVFVHDLNIDIGYGSRLIECDKFTTRMDKRNYFKFAKCRESSLTSSRKKFYNWLGIKPFSKILTHFLGFIVWDRCGCIVQIARKLSECKYGCIVSEKEEYLEPTQIVTAILKVNQLKQITPFEFVDHSFDRIDLTLINQQMGNDKVSGKKRMLNEIEMEQDNETKRCAKKQRLN